MVNYATPGYATAVFVSAQGVERIRTTAESHRRIAIIEVMGRHSGYLALGAAYGQPDSSSCRSRRSTSTASSSESWRFTNCKRTWSSSAPKASWTRRARSWAPRSPRHDPAGNKVLSGAAEALRQVLIRRLGDDYFTSKRRNESAKAAIFTRKVGHTQRGGRPILFDRFYGAQLGGHAVDLLLEGHVNGVSILMWNREHGFHVSSVDANDFRDRWGLIHARQLHPSFYDADNLRLSPTGVSYLLPIFGNAIGPDDMEAVRQTLFKPGNLTQPYHSVNVDVNKRIAFLD